MINYRVDIAVDRPAADVFPYLADINVFPKWMGGTSTQPISGGAMQVGYRYTYLTDEGKFEWRSPSSNQGGPFRPARFPAPSTGRERSALRTTATPRAMW
jgi:hypothetical protein